MFSDRADAGRQLGAALKKYKGADSLVLGIPRACWQARKKGPIRPYPLNGKKDWRSLANIRIAGEVLRLQGIRLHREDCETDKLPAIQNLHIVGSNQTGGIGGGIQIHDGPHILHRAIAMLIHPFREFICQNLQMFRAVLQQN